MESGALILPDNTVIDPSQPPPNIEFPKPDFTEIVQDHGDKNEGPILKPTFKSALQAKKRLQAFSSMRSGSLPSSPKKVKPIGEDKNEETATATTPKKTTKRGNYHEDKAKAVIEEIEELKREEQAYLELQRQALKRSRSRSRSTDRGRFKKVEKKSRNYRRRSPTPEKPRKSPKKVKRYPKNWREFNESDSNFELNRDFEVAAPAGNNELLRQVIFESPSLPIVSFKMKTVNREEKNVPFEYIRYTRAKPSLSYSANFDAIKESFLTRKMVLDTLPKEIVANIENLYSNSLKFQPDAVEAKAKKSKSWYSKNWKESENECKIFEKSVGLSFLQSYTGEEEDNDAEEEKKDDMKQEESKKKKKGGEQSESVEKKKKGEEHSEGAEKKKKSEDRSDDVDKKKKSEDHSEVVDKKKKGEEHSEDIEKKKKTEEHSEGVEKKKKGEEHSEKKKNKRASREKKKTVEGDATEAASKKKKQKKDKSKKKAKRTKDKKHKHKKSKERKKKEKEDEKLGGEKSERPSKQQVIEELKEIEEKIAKKKEETKEKNAKEEKGRKRKHSEREAEPPRKEKHEKPKKANDEHQDEHPLKKKLEKAKKHESEVKEAKKEHKSRPIEDHKEHKKSRHSDEVAKDRKRKSRWSEPIPREEVDLENLRIIEEIKSEIKKEEEENRKIIEEAKETTPDTDEYHSHWESDDDISSSVPVKQPLKMNRSWESDEELFERSHNRNKIPPEYTNLEIPLNIKNFSRRSNWDEKSLSVVDELKLLEEERRSISEERRKLEMEKQRILKLQEEAKLDSLDEKETENSETKETMRPRSSSPEAKVKKEKIDDFSIDSLNNSLLSTVSSTESNFPIAVLENEYEEFIKAVSSESSVPPPKKKPERRSSSSSSTASSWSTDSEQKKKKRKLKKKKKKKKLRDCEGLLLGKGNNIFNEFDIPVPSDLPEMVPTPVPVPSPILPLDTILPVKTPSLLLNSIIIDVQEKPPAIVEEPIVLNLTKPFVFSSIILPSKKTPLVDNSGLHLNDSDSADFTDKFVKKPEEKEKIEEDEKGTETETKVEEKEIEEEEETKIESPVDTKIETIDEKVEMNPKPIDDIANVPLPPEKPALREPPPQIKRSRSVSPRPRRRSRSRSRDHDPKRRSPIRRREPTPSLRRRHSPLRRRTPPRRRSSPRRRSPSPRRRSSPPRRRRRSPSLSPPRSRGGARKRTPSPRIRRASPLNSPLDGFKRSVADSTISDDMLPQPNPDDYNESPPSYGNGAKYYDRKGGAKDSPQLSPKRISLDDRISLVLGLEKNEAPIPLPKQIETYPNYNYNNQFGQQQQYTQYNQYVAPKNEYVPPFGPMIYSQPPPPIVKPVPTPSKVVQVGNILQVVPTEEMPPLVIENKVPLQPPERSQKIVQVGNMLQIVPAIMAATKPAPAPVPEPPHPVSKPVQIPEKQSAETVMKQKIAERKAERDKRRQERDRRRKEKEKKRKEKEKRKQMKLKIKTENMIKRAIQLETEALANDEAEEEGENSEPPVQWPPVPVIVSTTPSCKGILLQGASGKRKSVQFADGVRPGEGTSPSAGEELSSPPPNPRKLPKEKRYKKVKIPKKSKKKKVRVKVVKKVQVEEEDDDDDELDGLAPPSPPPGSPPPHVFPSRVKTHTINNVHQYVGNILQSSPAGFPFRSPMAQMPVVINRHQPPPGYMQGAFPQGFSDVNSLSHPHPQYQGVASHH